MKQGDQEVTEYYIEMLGLWQELNLSCEEEWEAWVIVCDLRRKWRTRESSSFWRG